MNPSSVVCARDLSKKFGNTTVVDHINFDIPKGVCFGILGPNGAGKTTTLNMLMGLSPPSSGTLEVLGYTLPKQAALARMRIGLVPQADNLDPDFSIIENLRIYGSYFRIPHPVLEPRINELLQFMQLSERAGERPDALSGGLKRRLTIARALINDPDLIILDEPTTGLDPQVRHSIWTRLRMLRSQGKTLLLTTHYMDEAERMCDELIIVDHGQILDRGSPADIINKHVEKNVFEIRGKHFDMTSLLEQTQACRLEKYGDTVFCYSDDPNQVRDILSHAPEVEYIRRHTNLEDVFLRMTGRDLRE